jgi:hypothetical protein
MAGLARVMLFLSSCSQPVMNKNKIHVFHDKKSDRSIRRKTHDVTGVQTPNSTALNRLLPCNE